MRKPQPPELLVNVYRDLRDRRLLLPALALLAAIVAVPVALSSSSASPPPPAPAAPANGSDEATAAEAAVVAEELGVTNYRKRLERFKSKNPFRQQFALPEVTSKVSGSSVTAPSSTSTSGAGSTSGGSTSTSTESSSASSTSTEPSTSTPPSLSSEPSLNTPKPITELIQRRVDVKIGEQGGPLEEKDGVKQLALLPDSTTPVVAFLGTSENGKRALFLVSTDVTSVTGDGVCLTTSSTCQFLSLQEGQAESLEYAPGPTTYRLRLLDIKDVVVNRTHG